MGILAIKICDPKGVNIPVTPDCSDCEVLEIRIERVENELHEFEQEVRPELADHEERITDLEQGLETLDIDLHTNYYTKEDIDTRVGNDKHYQHTQTIPASTWTVTHNLGKLPAITVMDSSGNVVEGDYENININQTILTFSGAFSGIAVFN